MASFQAIPKAKDLLDYTMERTTAKEAAGSTKPRFPKSQSFGYCKALRDAALSILERIQAANDYYFETQFEERLIALDEVDRDTILASWQAWDAHAAHGNTWRLRQEIRQQVKEILKEDI